MVKNQNSVSNTRSTKSLACRLSSMIASAGVMSANARGYVHSLFVHPRYVRQGLGRQLLDAAARWGMATGATGLWAEVSLTAEPLFRACGFHTERVQEAIVGSERLPRRLMRRDIAPGQRPSLPACAGTADVRLEWNDRTRHLDLLLLADEDDVVAVDARIRIEKNGNQ